MAHPPLYYKIFILFLGMILRSKGTVTLNIRLYRPRKILLHLGHRTMEHSEDSLDVSRGFHMSTVSKAMAH